MLNKYPVTLWTISTYLISSYGYMIPQPDVSEVEEIVSALAMAERTVSAAEPGESTIAKFAISDQAVRRRGARTVLLFNGIRLPHATVYMGMSKPLFDCQRLFRTVKGKVKKWH